MNTQFSSEHSMLVFGAISAIQRLQNRNQSAFVKKRCRMRIATSGGVVAEPVHRERERPI